MKTLWRRWVLLISVLTVALGWPVRSTAAEADLYGSGNLVAWCIVPFDAAKRGPEERAKMLERLGIRKLAYDWRDEHVATFDAEVEAMKARGIAVTAWWFPATLDGTARRILEVVKRQGIRPQLWVMGGGGPGNGVSQEAAVEAEAGRLRPVVEAAAAAGCEVALYNHGGWFGEPENQVAILGRLREMGLKNAGMVYNFHHGHGHLGRFGELVRIMKPWLRAVNLNGMVREGDQWGQKILTLGAGDQELEMMRVLRDSGWRGPVGVIDHRPETDSEVTLRENLRSLDWLRKELEKEGSGGPRPFPVPRREGVQRGEGRFGRGLHAEPRGMRLGSAAEFALPVFTAECFVKIPDAGDYRIILASGPKRAATHWEIYAAAQTGHLSLYVPGRGGDFRAARNVADGQWHHVGVMLEAERARLWVDGEVVFDGRLGPLPPGVPEGNLWAGQLDEGGLPATGMIDEVRIRRGVHPPRGIPEESLGRDADTVGWWPMDEAVEEADVPQPAAFFPPFGPLRPGDFPLHAHPHQRGRLWDFYARELLRFGSGRGGELLPPFPGLDGGLGGHFGRLDESAWENAAWQRMDRGSLQSGVYRDGAVTVAGSLCVSAGSQQGVFDPGDLRWRARWSGEGVTVGTRRFGFLDGLRPPAERAGQPEGEPAPEGDGRFRGFYRYGRLVVFSYEVGGEAWLESLLPDGRVVRGPAATSFLRSLTSGGPRQWPGVLRTRWSRGQGRPMAVDTLALPEGDGAGTVFHISALAFLPDGRAVVATFAGDIWIIAGMGPEDEVATWRKVAGGLHQPMGLAIEEGQLLVQGRDQLTRLHDLNGDGEMDWHECVARGWPCPDGGHDYVTGLSRDADGRWCFASGMLGVCRMGGDGKATAVATGLRNPNGLTSDAAGRLFTASQEGDWVPATALIEVQEGGHYGAGGPRDGPLGHLLPMLWLPRGVDHAAGGPVHLRGMRWPLSEAMLHLAWGSGQAVLVLRDESSGSAQACGYPLPCEFRAGPHRAAVRPQDGAVCVGGMTGWGTYAPDAGSLQAVRWTGGAESVLPAGMEVRDNGVLLRFTGPVTVPAGLRAAAQQWQYRRSAAYGSDEYSVYHPEVPGHDLLEVRACHRLGDGHEVFVEIPQLIPVDQLHLHLPLPELAAADFFFTVHRTGPPLRTREGWETEPKRRAPPQAGASAVVPAQPVSWEAGAAGRELEVKVVPGLRFDRTELRARRGERLSLRFLNPDVMPHNWVLAAAGERDRLGTMADAIISDPRAVARHYIPEGSPVLVHTPLVAAGGNCVIHFHAPSDPGRYPFLCTFPGHWRLMQGELVIE
jgi:sugar phosphate isomerase/epimerase